MSESHPLLLILITDPSRFVLPMSYNEQTIKLPNWCHILTEGGFEGLAVLFAHRKPFLPTCFVLRTNRPTQRHAFHTLINIDFIATRNIKTSEKKLFSLWPPFFLTFIKDFCSGKKPKGDNEDFAGKMTPWLHPFQNYTDSCIKEKCVCWQLPQNKNLFCSL